MTAKEWVPLLGIVLAVFMFNTSEFMPMALMTDISTDLGVSEADAGLIITAYAWVVAILALPLMLALNRVQYRRTMVAMLVLFIVLQIISATSYSYGQLMVSRIGIACTHAVFWSMASPLAVRLVSEEHRALAISAVSAATSVALIIGLPLGRMVGLTFGWRTTFVFVAVLAIVAVAIIALRFPRLENNGGVSLRNAASVFRNRTLIVLYLVAIVVLVGHYTGYSYIEPFLGQVAGISDTMITLALTIFGIAGLAGTALYARFYGGHRYAFITAMLLCMAASLLLIDVVSSSAIVVLILFVVWGMFITAFLTTSQTEVIGNTPAEGNSVAMSVLFALMNLGAGIGTLAGGWVCDSLTVADIGYVGGAILVVGAVVCFAVLFPLMRRQDRAGAQADTQ